MAAKERPHKESYDVAYPWWFKVILGLVLGVLWLYLKLFHCLRIEKGAGLSNDDPTPWVVLGNHCSLLDFLLMSMVFYPRRIHFVMSNVFLARWWGSPVIYGLQQIPKSQFFAEAKSVMSMKRAVKAGCSIGIYPEGRVSLTGRTGYIAPATGKLIKSFQVPVVVVREEGVSLCKPLWAKRPHWGPVKVSAFMLLNQAEIQQLSAAEIEGKLEQALCYDDYCRQEKEGLIYRSRRPAEGLELMLYRCPACGQAFAMASHKKILSCRACGFGVGLTAQNLLEPLATPLTEPLAGEAVTAADCVVAGYAGAVGLAGICRTDGRMTIPGWYDWQIFYLRQALIQGAEYRQTCTLQVLPKDNFMPMAWGEAVLAVGRTGIWLQAQSAQLLPDVLSAALPGVSSRARENTLFFPAGQLPTITGTLGSYVDFPGAKALYRVTFAQPGQPAFWMQAVEAVALLDEIQQEA